MFVVCSCCLFGFCFWQSRLSCLFAPGRVDCHVRFSPGRVDCHVCFSFGRVDWGYSLEYPWDEEEILRRWNTLSVSLLQSIFPRLLISSPHPVTSLRDFRSNDPSATDRFASLWGRDLQPENFCLWEFLIGGKKKKKICSFVFMPLFCFPFLSRGNFTSLETIGFFPPDCA